MMANGRYEHTIGTVSSGQTGVGRARVYTMGTAVIQRSTYSIAGQTVAIQVSGDPHPDNNGIFFIHSDEGTRRPMKKRHFKPMK
ncbi:MAG: hypothetical protein KF770_08230 [Anaerolineae bacterium]|nr:hypothetical protein [Anaerolineae bacterium]